MRLSDLMPSIPGYEGNATLCRTVELTSEEVADIFRGFRSAGAVAVMAPGGNGGRVSAEIQNRHPGAKARSTFASSLGGTETLVGLLISPTDEEMDGY